MVYRLAMICSLLHSNSVNHGNFLRGLWLGLSRLPVSRLAAGLVDDLGERYVLIKYTPRAYWFSFTWIARFTLYPIHSGGGRRRGSCIVGVDYLPKRAGWEHLQLGAVSVSSGIRSPSPTPAQVALTVPFADSIRIECALNALDWRLHVHTLQFCFTYKYPALMECP